MAQTDYEVDGRSPLGNVVNGTKGDMQRSGQIQIVKFLLSYYP